MEMTPFTSVQDFAKYLAIGSRSASGNGAVPFIARAGKDNLFYTVTPMKQCYHFRPMKMCKSLEEIQKGTPFEINLEVDGDNTSFRDAEGRLTAFITTEMAKRASEFWEPSVAAKITSPEAALVKFDGPFIRYGKNGYPDTIRLKVLGSWGKYVADFKPRTTRLNGAEVTTVDYCKWTPRNSMIDPLKPSDTRFYVYVGLDASGNAKWSDVVKDADGTVRMAGPMDCWPGAEVLPVFSADQIYFQKGFGFSAVARALYIKPKPKEPSTGGAGVFSSYSSAVPLLPGASLVSAADMEGEDVSM